MVFEEKINAVWLTKDTAPQFVNRGAVSLPQGWIICVCNNGEADFVVNSRRMRLTKNSVLTILPEQMVGMENYSDDLSLYFIYAPTDAVMTMSMNSSEADCPADCPVYLHPKMLPRLINNDEDTSEVYTLSPAVINNLVHLSTVLTSAVEDNRHRLSSLLLEALTITIVDTIPAPVPQKKRKSRQQLIASQFFTEVIRDFRSHHNVSYYAQKMDISPKYLSTIIRGETGTAALHWINRIVIYEAKKMLRTSRMSINEISRELNFNSPSAFIRYFKKLTGTTPLVYRG